MLKLKDIVYEITPRCNKGCIECGSAAITGLPHPDVTHIGKIVDSILTYPPETITITGGEPGSMPNGVLNAVVHDLAQKCKVNIVTNGALFDPEVSPDFNVIGVSINRVEDFEEVNHGQAFGRSQFVSDKLVMITNFGTHNVWCFDQLAEIAAKFPMWQIQLTMGEYMLPATGIEYLMNKINDLKINYVLADNLQPEGRCLAGINMCGITYNGNVIPCLSERACCDGTVTTYGNLFTESLKSIWETKFTDIRFVDNGWCRKCKSFIDYPPKKQIREDIRLIQPYDDPIPDRVTPMEIQLYGVADVGVYAYAVFDSSDYAHSTYGTRTIITN